MVYGDYKYDFSEKEKCWYKKICDKSLCGEEFCIRHYKMDYLVYLAMLEGKQKYSIDLYPDKDDYSAYSRLKVIKNDIKTFVEDGKNLLIYSKNTGNGKTEWSKKLLLSYLNSIWPVTELKCRALFISMPKLVQAMKENISKENEYYQYINSNVIDADLVVWDEINYKEWTQFELDYMLNIISQRLSIGKSNIYTTNYDLDTITKKLGTRLASRIVGGSELIEFVGKDQRNVGVSF